MLAILKLSVIIFLFMGCVRTPIVMPDEPMLRDVSAYQIEQSGFLCFDAENQAILQHNMKAIIEYALKLREILKKQKGEE